jgi:hypothetical protein
MSRIINPQPSEASDEKLPQRPRLAPAPLEPRPPPQTRTTHLHRGVVPDVLLGDVK